MSGPFRQTDAVLTISQDNARQAIEITGANEAASEVVGFPMDELKGMPFKELLPEKIAEMLDDYVEFEDGANDVGEVLRRVRNFQLRDGEGGMRSFRLRVVRHHSQSLDEFMLIMQDEDEQRKAKTFMDMLKENIEGHTSLHPDTSTPDRSTLIKALEYVTLHLDNLPQGACLAVIELDGYGDVLAKHGENACHKMMQNAAAWCQQNLRGNDVITQVNDNCLGLALLGASREPAKMVLNRLRWLLGSQKTLTPQGVEVQSTCTIVFTEINREQKAEEVLDLCLKTLEEKPESQVNLVVEV